MELFEMNNFSKFEENNGIQEIQQLMDFVDNFIEDPAIFFELSQAERYRIEKQMDQAFLTFLSLQWILDS